MKIHIKKDFGNSGEDIAVQYLKSHGHIILKRNFYCKQGEIDIITKDKNEIVFIEVKHLYKTARYFLYKNKMLNEFVRFDVVEILIKSGKFNINHIKQII